MRIPVVKEHGSWVIFILSSIIAIFAGVDASMDEVPYPKLILMASGLALLINSKKPFASAIRTEKERPLNIYWFLAFSILGLAMVIPFIFSGITHFLIFLPFVMLYIVLLLAGKEHSLIAELIGFALLCISAPVIYFVLTEDLSLRLYLIVSLFFSAGVFKVRVRMKKGLQYRVIMIVYCLIVFIVYKYLDVSTIILLPLLENVFTALWVREERLKTTGKIELLKGVVFTLLFIFIGRESM